MTPNNFPNRRSGDSKSLRDGNLHLSFRESVSNVLDLIRLQTRVPVASFFGVALHRCVGDVLFARPKPKVVGIYTHRIVPAGAVVQDVNSFRNGSSVDNPRGPVGLDCARALASFTADGAITSSTHFPTIDASGPQPAGLLFVYLGVKALGKVFGQTLRGKVFAGNFEWHRFNLLNRCLNLCLARQRRQPLRASSIFTAFAYSVNPIAHGL